MPVGLLAGQVKQRLSVVTRDRPRPFLRFARLQGFRIWRRLFPLQWPVNPEGRLFINVGSGYVTHPLFVNVDALAAAHVHFSRTVEDLGPFKDDSADLIYVSHCLEHISHRKVNSVLAEWRRVLKPGGVLRLGVPDFDQLLAFYEASGRNVEAIQPVLMGGQTYALNAHYTVFTEQSLRQRLLDVGFLAVRRWQWGTDELTSLPDYTSTAVEVGERMIRLSLNLEAIK